MDLALENKPDKTKNLTKPFFAFQTGCVRAKGWGDDGPVRAAAAGAAVRVPGQAEAAAAATAAAAGAGDTIKKDGLWLCARVVLFSIGMSDNKEEENI